MKTQRAFHDEAFRKIAEGNEVFLHLVSCGLTREELARLIERRPALWSRFSKWLETLPTKESA